MSEWLKAKLNRLPKPHVESKPATGRFEAVADESEIVKDVTADYRKETIRRSIYSVPEQNLDQALKDTAMCVMRDVVGSKLFDEIIDATQSGTSESSTHIIARLVLEESRKRTACWGIALDDSRVDRLELSEKAQEEILQRWKQMARTSATKEEEDAAEAIPRDPESIRGTWPILRR